MRACGHRRPLGGYRPHGSSRKRELTRRAQPVQSIRSQIKHAESAFNRARTFGREYYRGDAVGAESVMTSPIPTFPPEEATDRVGVALRVVLHFRSRA